MIEDLPAIREQLSGHWQAIAIDLVKRGFRAEAVFETMFTVGVAGWLEVHGKEAVAERLVLIAQKLSQQVREENEALSEAAQATKN